MKINQHTRVSEIIRANEEAIEAIIRVSDHFKKLRNPLMRSILAPRVTIPQAASIAGCEAESIYDELRNIGFEIELPQNKETVKKPEIKGEIIPPKPKIELDVRELIQKGNDPIQLILSKAGELKKNECLLIVNDFEPVPLIGLMENKGYQTVVKRPEPEVVHTFIIKPEKTKTDTSNKVKKASTGECNKEQFESIKSRFENNFIETDVRDLEMPEPMITILRKLEGMPSEKALFVHHKRVPQYLLPQLRERGYDYVMDKIDEDNLKIIIYEQ